MFGGLLGVCVGVYGLLDGTTSAWLGLPMLAVGLLAAVGIAVGGRRTGRTRYRPDPWALPEWLVAGVRRRGRGGDVRQRRDRTRAAVPGLGDDGAAGAVLACAGILVAMLPAVLAPRCPSCRLRRATRPWRWPRDPLRGRRRPVRRRAAAGAAGVDLTPRARLALVVGRTGSGQDDPAARVNGLVPHFSGGTLTGRVVVDGRDTRDHRPRDLADVVGFVGQDPLAGFVTDTVEDELAYGMESLGLPADVMRKRVEETLDLLGLADLRDRPLAHLSGGQQQRVAIGSVLTTHPGSSCSTSRPRRSTRSPPRRCSPRSSGWCTTSA